MSDDAKGQSYFGYTMRDINAMERQIEKLTETNGLLQAVENTQKAEITTLKERIEALKTENGMLADEKNILQEGNKALQTENNNLKQEVEAAAKKQKRKAVLADLDK